MVRIIDSPIIDDLSRKLDDVLLFGRIILNSDVLLSKTFTPDKDLLGLISGLCKDKWCLGHARFYNTEGREVGDAKIYYMDGKIAACIIELNGEKIYGAKATKIVMKPAISGIKSIKVMIYSFEPSLLPQEVIEVIKTTPVKEEAYIKPMSKEGREYIPKHVPAQPVQHPITPPSKPEEEKPPEKKPITPHEEVGAKEPKDYILEKLKAEKIPVTSIGIIDAGKNIILDVVCDEEAEIFDLENVGLIALKYYIESLGEENIKKDVKVTIHHAETFSKTYKVKENPRVWKVIGTVPEIIQKYGLYLGKYKYKVKKNMLELSLTFKRTGIYSSVNISDLVREIYDILKPVWRGDLVVKAKIGTWGIEEKYPK